MFNKSIRINRWRTGVLISRVLMQVSVAQGAGCNVEDRTWMFKYNNLRRRGGIERKRECAHACIHAHTHVRTPPHTHTHMMLMCNADDRNVNILIIKKNKTKLTNRFDQYVIHQVNEIKFQPRIFCCFILLWWIYLEMETVINMS